MTFGLVKGSSPTDNLHYGISIQSLLPRPNLVSRSQTAANSIIVLPNVERSTVSRDVVLTADTVTLMTRVSCSHVANCRTNSHQNERPVTGPIAAARQKWLKCE